MKNMKNIFFHMKNQNQLIHSKQKEEFFNIETKRTLKGKFANEKYVNKTYTKERKFDKSFGEKKGQLTKKGSHWKTWKKRL